MAPCLFVGPFQQLFHLPTLTVGLTMPPPVKYDYLISRSGDIVFSVTVGALAYFLNERDNPRAQNGKTLFDMLKRARQKKVQEREAKRQPEPAIVMEE
ncbi:hypothetical protein BDF20DRAFT_915353 [Mycotypha africana]|uniref:uncharacterized protein n=1 Tax=Mycotypha africana TaxID=64632 RepID=UPI00230071B2|nr:uncharacterized protein BDF20DRAFT_915353 [Mycotypha africana]KAI8971554.1 hypothetical protein BDF20DRAFT_915353 [Mycotypha africana]